MDDEFNLDEFVDDFIERYGADLEGEELHDKIDDMLEEYGITLGHPDHTDIANDVLRAYADAALDDNDFDDEPPSIWSRLRENASNAWSSFRENTSNAWSRPWVRWTTGGVGALAATGLVVVGLMNGDGDKPSPAPKPVVPPTDTFTEASSGSGISSTQDIDTCAAVIAQEFTAEDGITKRVQVTAPLVAFSKDSDPVVAYYISRARGENFTMEPREILSLQPTGCDGNRSDGHGKKYHVFNDVTQPIWGTAMALACAAGAVRNAEQYTNNLVRRNGQHKGSTIAFRHWIVASDNATEDFRLISVPDFNGNAEADSAFAGDMKQIITNCKVTVNGQDLSEDENGRNFRITPADFS